MNLIFIGPPGAGKGTFAKKAEKDFGIPHISTGDLFRNAVKNQTELGKKVAPILERGELVPDEMTLDLLKERLEKDDAQNGYILDGFPRTIPQADALEDICSKVNVINFIVPEELILKRLSGRRVCKNCGATYNVYFMPSKKEGVCDSCEGELIIRKDDTEASVKNRLKVYKDQSEPLIEYYRKKGNLFDVDGTETPDTVINTIKEKVKN